MKTCILIVLLACATAGCSTLTGPGGAFHRQSLDMKLSRAVTLQKQGETAAAARLLAEICADTPEPGVTDEAMFRLSLIRLGSAEEEEDMTRADRDLKLLAKYYPSSPWAPLAASLTAFLASLEEADGQDARRDARQDEAQSSLALERGFLKETNPLAKRMNALKQANLSLKKEVGALKESSRTLAQENRDLRQTIEKLKALELELRAVPKH